jgi:hypothetical protein
VNRSFSERGGPEDLWFLVMIRRGENCSVSDNAEGLRRSLVPSLVGVEMELRVANFPARTRFEYSVCHLH